jgi:hypothetical protein
MIRERFSTLVAPRSSVNGLLLTGSPRFRAVSLEERRSLCRLKQSAAADVSSMLVEARSATPTAIAESEVPAPIVFQRTSPALGDLDVRACRRKATFAGSNHRSLTTTLIVVAMANRLKRRSVTVGARGQEM